jgi:hypothetical protein
MHNRIRWIGFLSIGLATMVTTDAMARTCVLRSSSGACKVWSGSVSCENLNATGVGNVTKDDKYMGCMVSALPGGENAFPVIVFCANNGGNVAPGVNATIAGSLSGIATIFPEQVDKNGVAKGINVKASPTDGQLDSLDTVCEAALNTNWFAIDVVPIDTLVSVLLLDDSMGEEVVDQANFECHLPNPESLGWDKKANAPERRQYNCVQQ